MKLASNHLEAFYSVARHLSFSKGAREIHITQSAASQRISALEENIETALFIRDRAKLRLTTQGEKLLRYCQSQQQQEYDLLSEIKFTDLNSQKIGGEIRIGGFSSIARSALLPALAPVLQKNSDIGFTLVVKELTQLFQLLKSGEVDFIITNKNPKREDVEAIFLGSEENVLVESKKFPDSITFLDHDAENITIRSYFRGSQKGIKNRFVKDVYGLIDGVKHGLGRAVVPRHLIKNEKDFKILYPENILKVNLYLLFYRQPYYGKLHKLVTESIQQYFKVYFQSNS